MNGLEIAGGIVVLVLSIAIIIICLMQDQKSQDSMTAALTGASTESFYGKNEGRTKEAILNKVTRAFAILLFIVTLALNLIPLFID